MLVSIYFDFQSYHGLQGSDDALYMYHQFVDAPRREWPLDVAMLSKFTSKSCCCHHAVLAVTNVPSEEAVRAGQAENIKCILLTYFLVDVLIGVQNPNANDRWLAQISRA